MISPEQLREHMADDIARAWEATLATESGRLMVWDLLAACGVFHGSYRPDATATAFAEGRRSIGLEVFNNRVLADPDRFALMAHEFRGRADAIERAIQKEQEKEQ